jgi:ABC-2 type transport system ATP-binding protein
MKIIEARNICKTYGSQMVLKNISLDIEKGSSFAILGPNGAGKTTFVRTLLSLTRVDSGSFRINGKESRDPHSRLGMAYLPEKFTFYPYYTVEEVIKFYGKMQRLEGKVLLSKLEFALERMNITQIRSQKLKSLSKGQMQRVGIANLMMGNMELLILDEPFSGLDPIGIKDLKTTLEELKKMGKTIFINSHILSEMEQICDEAAIMNMGEICVHGKISELCKEQSLEDYFYKVIKGDH